MLCFRAVFSSSVLAALLALPVHADTLPAQLTLPAIEDALQERAQALSPLTFTWNRSVREKDACVLTPAQIVTMHKEGVEEWEADYRKQGLTDEVKIKHDAEETTQSIMAGLEGGSVNYANTGRSSETAPRRLFPGRRRSLMG